MSYCGRVNATRVAASTLAVSGLHDLLAVQYAYGATAGVVTIRDGGQSAAVLLQISTPASVGAGELYLPGQGIRADTGLYVDLGAGATGVTVIYG